MIAWIDSIAGWDRSLPAVLVTPRMAAEQRGDLLHALVVGAMNLDPDQVVIARTEGRPPEVVKPTGSGLHLSLGSRGPFIAAAIAASPVGVDVECADERGEVPWNVLHTDETAMLSALRANVRAAAFARLWSLKEAYLKALGLGLSRETSSFAVRFADHDRAIIQDPGASAKVAEARTTWRTDGGIHAAVSAVLLERCPFQRGRMSWDSGRF